MPLSEHEQRLLDQLEQQLNASDPKLATTLGQDRGRPVSTRYVVIGVLLAVVGILVLLLGISNQLIIVGVVGVVVLGGGIYVATLSRSEEEPKEGAPKAKAQSSFMENLEKRWDQRQG